MEFGCRTAIIYAPFDHACRWNKWVKFDPPGRPLAVKTQVDKSLRLGVNVVAYKLLAFFAAGVLAGVAGAVWIPSLLFVSPEHFQLSWGLWLVGVILIGGVGSLHGVILGSLFITGTLELLKLAVIPLSDVFPALTERFLYVKEAAFGLAIVLFLLYEPRGLAYRWQQLKHYFNLWPFSY